MFDSMQQMVSLDGCWFTCFNSSDCCGGVNASWDVHWNLGNPLSIASQNLIKKDKGMLLRLPFTVGRGTKCPKLGNILTRDQITYLLVIFLCEPLCSCKHVFSWIQLEYCHSFDIISLNANMPNRKSCRGRRKTPKRVSSPIKWKFRTLQSREPWAWSQGHITNTK